MEGYTPKVDQAAFNFADQLKHEFFQVVQKHLRFQDQTRINWIHLDTEKSYIQAFDLVEGDQHNVIKLVDYSDYFDIVETDAVSSIALKAGMGAVSTYNALLGAAMRKYGYGLHVTELLQPADNLRFTCMYNCGPSLSDPEGLRHGWVAWRFKFGAGRITPSVQQ